MRPQRRRIDRARTSGSTGAPAQPTFSSGADETIARRAYHLYEVRGREDGHDWDDWLQAERDIRNRADRTE